MLTQGIQRLILLSAFCLVSTGCVMSNLPMKAPSASGTLTAPAGTSVEAVFSCVENSVRPLHREQSFWSDQVTRRDDRAGIIETGNFEENNVIGFRVRVQFTPESKEVSILIKGAGAYFTDLGVEKALVDFDARMQACLSAV
jgi:hypothetical protein